MLATTEEIIDDIRQGRRVILVDDIDRENEGDIVIAAEAIDAAAMNFMATHVRGLVCLTLTEDGKNSNAAKDLWQAHHRELSAQILVRLGAVKERPLTASPSLSHALMQLGVSRELMEAANSPHLSQLPGLSEPARQLLPISI